MTSLPSISRWDRFQANFTSNTEYDNPLQDAELRVTFTAPSGRQHHVYGFWDGGRIWRVRFIPTEVGSWHYRTQCSDTTNQGLHDIVADFECSEGAINAGSTVFQRHGPISIAPSGRHLEHADGTPFFWLADTCWNGPLLSTEPDWQHYVDVRTQQKFTAVQWVGAQWISAPQGDIHQRLPFSGHEAIAVDPVVYQRLDQKQDALTQAGLLSVPVLLWAAVWGPPEVMAINPGLTLPEDQCILLARYMVARWGGNPVVWILPGDGVYTGEHAARWQRIGEAVFGNIDHAPVTLHPSGKQWYGADFEGESWLDFIGYQSCHYGDDESLAWIVNGPPATAWQKERAWPVINLEPNYEGHVAINDHSHPFNAFDVRRASYWSLLVSPTAGVSYGGHGVWGWDDGSGPPVAHPDSGRALPWQDALQLPGAGQMTVLQELFTSLPWQTLRPAPELLVARSAPDNVGETVVVAQSTDQDLVVAYLPTGGEITLHANSGQSPSAAQWIDPRRGERFDAALLIGKETIQVTTPSTEDWLLVITF